MFKYLTISTDTGKFNLTALLDNNDDSYIIPSLQTLDYTNNKVERYISDSEYWIIEVLLVKLEDILNKKDLSRSDIRDFINDYIEDEEKMSDNYYNDLTIADLEELRNIIVEGIKIGFFDEYIKK